MRRLVQGLVNGSETAYVPRKLYGQPHPDTHPHLVNSDQQQLFCTETNPWPVTVGISRSEFEHRRRQLVAMMPENSVAFFPTHSRMHMSHDVHFLYRPDVNFSYLTGFHEPSALLMIEKKNGAPYTTLFVTPASPEKEIWEGPSSGVETAIEWFGADEAYAIDHLMDKLVYSSRLSGQSIFYNDIPTDHFIKTAVLTAINGMDYSCPRKLVEKLRVTKSPAEIALMKKACLASGEAFEETLRATKRLRTETQLHAKIDYECKMRGLQGLAYPPVVATGQNALILHYIANNQPDGDLVLVDAGGEYWGYTADISRTWPVSGKFTEGQRALYEAACIALSIVLIDQVLYIQKACIEATKKKGASLSKLHTESVHLVIAALHAVGLGRYANQEYFKIYPHSIGHYLGMDTHDTPLMNNHEALRPGSIITIEPGLYVPDHPDIPEWLRGIGIRIEDDVLITETGSEVLTAAAPKEVDHLEELINSSAE